MVQELIKKFVFYWQMYLPLLKLERSKSLGRLHDFSNQVFIIFNDKNNLINES